MKNLFLALILFSGLKLYSQQQHIFYVDENYEIQHIFWENGEFKKDNWTKNANAKKFQKLFQTLLKNGVFIAPSQFEVVFLSDAHTQTDLNKTLDAYHSALKSVKN